MALDLLTKFIRETAPVDVLEERALLLAGEPQDTIEFGIAAFCAELRTLCAAETTAIENICDCLHDRSGFNVA